MGSRLQALSGGRHWPLLNPDAAYWVRQAFQVAILYKPKQFIFLMIQVPQIGADKWRA